MKRIILFVATNLAVLVVLSVVLRLLGVDRVLTQEGIDYRGLLVFSVVVGFTGSIISLLISKQAAKWSTKAQMIDGTESSDARWIVETVRKFAEKAGIAMPEVAIYDGPPNAFATGPSRNNSLVAVSTGLLQSMSRDEVEAVLGHEVAHVANGDMVTMTLIQGVVNTFVVFLSRVVGFFIDRAVFRNNEGTGPGFFVTVMVCQIVFGILASVIVAWFSRQREFRADAGSAAYMGTPKPMMNALARLGGIEPEPLPEGVRALGITDRKGFMALFSTHPPMEERIARLRERAA
jgi:heat shock protein HtpX